MNTNNELDQEHAAGRRHEGTFPVKWGYPPGRPYSDERASWVRKQVMRYGRLTPHQQLEAKNARLSATLRVAYLNRIRQGP